MELVEQCDPKRSALIRIGRASQLVEQYQAVRRDVLEHFLYVQQVSGKTAEALGNRLVIADVSQYVVEYRKLGFRARHRNRSVREQGEQPGSLERHRLPARVWAAN